MNFGITQVSIAPLRAANSHVSEMLTQLLFGESFSIIRKKGDWQFIETARQSQEGWMYSKQGVEISSSTFQILQSQQNTYSFDLVSSAISNQEHIPIILGSTLPHFDGLSFQFNNRKIIYNGQVLTPKQNEPSLAYLEKIAYKYLNAPLLWGGRTPFGIDAPGLVQQVFQLCGYALARTIHQQQTIGKTVQLLNNAKAGDVVFFSTTDEVNHVGILLSKDSLIHCEERVKISRVDSHGIYDDVENVYTKRIRNIKRII